MLNNSCVSSTADPQDDKVKWDPVQPLPEKKPAKPKHSVREIEYLLMEEFNHVPGWVSNLFWPVTVFIEDRFLTQGFWELHKMH